MPNPIRMYDPSIKELDETSVKEESGWGGRKIGIVLIILQSAFVAFFAIFCVYDPEADSRFDWENQENSFQQLYGPFQDVHVMIFIGFGFLMAFLRRYGYSAISYNFLISAVAIQWYIIVHALIKCVLEGKGLEVGLSLTTLVEADFAAAVVLISFGVVLGKTSPLELLFLTMVEVPLYAVNANIMGYLGNADAGGSVMIHLFGAYFGCAVSLMLRRNWDGNDADNNSVYHSDHFSMLGTLFLWLYWPSFNAVVLPTPNQQQRAVINTVLSLSACVLATIGTSALVSPKGKLQMTHIENATLAGGVAVGTVANFMIMPFGAIVIGALSGVVSTVGYQFIGPFLQTHGLHDTCGVHNLHGLPALIAGISGIAGASVATKETYGEYGLAGVFPNAANGTNVTDSAILPLVQAECLGISLSLGIGGGLITGLLLRLLGPILDAVPLNASFRDDALWSMPGPLTLDDTESEEPRQLSQEELGRIARDLRHRPSSVSPQPIPINASSVSVPSMTAVTVPFTNQRSLSVPSPSETGK